MCEMPLSLLTRRLILSFGYVVDGAEFLEDMDETDIILSAKVTGGIENLVQPS